jgi:hypothetical protein
MFNELIIKAGDNIIRIITKKCFALALAYSLLLVLILRSIYIFKY